MGTEIVIINIILFFIMLSIIVYLKNKLLYTINQNEITQKKLEQEKTKLDEMLSIIPVPILITNNETRKIVFANRYSSIQYNISAENLIGMSISELYTSDSQGDNILNAMLDGVPLVNYETKFKLASGERIDALLSLIPIEYNNKPCRMGSISDITNIKDTQKELLQQKENAQASSRAKSEFLANMSHEVRTPLNAIMGFIELLQENETDKTKQKYLNIINSSSKSLLDIINDILDFSKIESGNLSIDKIDFNPVAEFKLTKKLFKARFDEKSIRFHTSHGDFPLSLNGDILRIKQVINNLLSNAIKFTPKNKNIYLDIEHNDGKLYVNVKDEGIGISNQYQENIFEAFTQEDSSTTRKYGGTGLGLTISYKLVEAMGGELKLKSKLEHGSEFYFTIPLEKGKQIIEQSKTDLSTELKAHILVVEDNKANQMFMKVVLKKMGLTFDIVNDGVEAYKAFELLTNIKKNKSKYDIILMDENMPNMGGVESTKKILNIEKDLGLKHTPIIALTANALKGDRERFICAGMDEYITKPVNKVELYNILGKFLNDK